MYESNTTDLETLLIKHIVHAHTYLKITVNACTKRKYAHTYAQAHTTIFNSVCSQLMDDFSGNLIEMTFTVAGLPRC